MATPPEPLARWSGTDDSSGTRWRWKTTLSDLQQFRVNFGNFDARPNVFVEPHDQVRSIVRRIVAISVTCELEDRCPDKPTPTGRVYVITFCFSEGNTVWMFTKPALRPAVRITSWAEFEAGGSAIKNGISARSPNTITFSHSIVQLLKPSCNVKKRILQLSPQHLEILSAIDSVLFRTDARPVPLHADTLYIAGEHKTITDGVIEIWNRMLRGVLRRRVAPHALQTRSILQGMDIDAGGNFQNVYHEITPTKDRWIILWSSDRSQWSLELSEESDNYIITNKRQLQWTFVSSSSGQVYCSDGCNRRELPYIEGLFYRVVRSMMHLYT